MSSGSGQQRGESGLLDRLPNHKIIAKDLSIAEALMPGNPFCRYDPSDKTRKYCSKDLWENKEGGERYIIPTESKIPRPLVVCGVCGKDSYRTEDHTCGRCGCAMFDCPECGEEVHGKTDDLDECPHCGVGYDW